MSQKGFVHFLTIFCILILLAVAGAIYYFYPSKPSTSQASPTQKSSQTTQSPQPANPKYTDSDLGIEFTYPVDFEVVQESEQDYSVRVNGNFRKNFSGYMQYDPPIVLGTVLVKPKNIQLKGQFDEAPFSIWVFENPNDLSMSQWYVNYWYYPFVWGDYSEKISGKYAPSKEATISGKMANYIIIDYQPNKPQLIYIKSKGKMLLLRIPQTADQKISQQILSSFKIDE